MPIVGHFTGGVDFSDLMYVLSEELVDAGGTVVTLVNAVMYGEWINSIINLVLVGFVLFVIIKAYNKSKKKKRLQLLQDLRKKICWQKLEIY